MKNFGTQKLRESGNALVVKLPTQWLATHGAQVSDPLFSVLTLDEIIRVYLDPVEWGAMAKVRLINTSPFLTIAAKYVARLGLTKDSVVELTADKPHRVLMIRRVS